MDRAGFWYRVLVARYGEEAGRLEVGGRSVSPWWREVAKIRDGAGEAHGGWFTRRVSKVLGDGTNTFFWFDRWLGDVPLCMRFARLFDLATNKLSTIADMCTLGWEEEGEAWSWRRRLWAWEEDMLGECGALLNNVVVQSNVSDRWQWDSDPYEGYSVRGAYQTLTDTDVPTVDGGEEHIWHKQVSLKVSILSWRLMKDRLPTRSNLQRRGLIDATANTCVSGCGMEETANHMFLHCDVFSSLWQHIRSWISMSGAYPQNISEHFHQFTHSTSHSKARRSFLQLIWLLCVWLIWNERNNRLFKNIETPIIQLLEKAKYHSFWWLKANNTNFVYGSQRWWSDSLLCLGID